MTDSNKPRLFLILFLTGMIGTISLLLIDLPAVAALIPRTLGDIPTFTPVVKFVGLIQPSILLAVAVVIGVALAPRVGLSAPVAEALAERRSIFTALRPQLAPGVIGGLAGGVSIVLISLLTKPYLSVDALDRISKFSRILPFPTRLFYGGVTEELLLRWGFMTFLVWAAWRVLQKGRNAPTTAYFVSAILFSSLVFGAGHLPVAYVLLPDSFSVPLVLFVILANSVFGVIAGFLYWRRGLESAMIAHMICHVVLAVASSAGAYF